MKQGRKKPAEMEISRMLARINEDGSVEPITTQVHDWWFRQWMRNMAPADFQRVVNTLNEHINTTGRGEIITTSWIPGSDWTGTPFLWPDRVAGHDGPARHLEFRALSERPRRDHRPHVFQSPPARSERSLTGDASSRSRRSEIGDRQERIMI